MKRPILLLAVLAGCPADNTNAPVLWLAPNGTEAKVQLVESMPSPF